MNPTRQRGVLLVEMRACAWCFGPRPKRRKSIGRKRSRYCSERCRRDHSEAKRKGIAP